MIFMKMVAAGNDFVVVNAANLPAVPLKRLAEKICQRKYGIGADGLLLCEESRSADAKMRIFNPDGSEAEMCGNGARCFSLYVNLKQKRKTRLKIETKAGMVSAEVRGETVKIKLTDPKAMRLDTLIPINNRKLRVNFINTGVPHAVIFVEGLDGIDVAGLGRQIRYHKYFAPAGTNVNFVEVVSRNSARIRTYERGVENETLACGTGSSAAALITAVKLGLVGKNMVKVITAGGETLKVYFEKTRTGFNDVWLEGEVKIVYGGEYHV